MSNSLNLKPLQFKTKLPTDIPTLSFSKMIEDNDDPKKIYRGTIEMKSGRATLYHDEVTQKKITVPFWGYALEGEEAAYPGPTIEVDENQIVEIDWKNSVDADECHPVTAIKVAYAESDEIIPQNVVGAPKKSPKTMGANSNAYFTPHQHGGKTAPKYDGGPLDMMSSGQSHVHRYENEQRAAMLWYHDHAMHTTRLNAYAGLAGLYVIRGEEERSLNLPSGKYEIPLVIQDRNLTSKNKLDKLINGNKKEAKVKLLHKVEFDDGPLEFFGPLNLVNGAIWPKHEVEDTRYRVRILNGANSRSYQLVFAEKDTSDNYTLCSKIKVKQIGADGGLMQSKGDTLVDVPSDGLIMSPAERVDLIIDFSEVEDGTRIYMLNLASSPFAGAGITLDEIMLIDPESDTNRNPYPEVMCFDVKATSTECLADTLAERMQTLPSYATAMPKFDDVKKVRTVAVVEKETPNGAVLVLWELMPASEIKSHNPILRSNRKVMINGEYFVAVAERFHDPVSIIIPKDSTERWRFINLTADTHPMHVHLVQFFPISRRNILTVNNVEIDPDDDEKGDKILDITAQSITLDQPIVLTVADMTDDDSEEDANDEPALDEEKEAIGMGLDDNEKCLKDTLRMNPGEMVEMIAKFDTHCGRFVYHCHLLEHEDHDMMRQFIVTRNDLHNQSCGNGKAMPDMSGGNSEMEGMFPISVGIKC